MVRNFTAQREAQHRYVQRVTANLGRHHARDPCKLKRRHLANWMWFVKYIICDDDVRDIDDVNRVLATESRRSRAPMANVLHNATNYRVHVALIRYFYYAALQPGLPFSIDLCPDGSLRVISQVPIAQYGELQRYLIGYLYQVSVRDYNTLLGLGYSSMYQHNNDYYIMYGPLSLCNHCCLSPVWFTIPRQCEFDFDIVEYRMHEFGFLERHVPSNRRAAVVNRNTRGRPAPRSSPRRGLPWRCVKLHDLGDEDDEDVNTRPYRPRRGRELYVRYIGDLQHLPFQCQGPCCMPR